MSRSDTERDIIETLGQVPDFFASMPDSTLEHEWPEFKTTQLTDTALTVREKHLIGLGVAAATHCPYCTYFHRNAASMMGASDAEIEEAARFASDTAKYSAYLHGLQIPIADFKKQADEMGEHLARQAAEAQRKAA
jgi:AhpD family alkylhydroperoxidase